MSTFEVGGELCLANELGMGRTAAAALIACRSPESPVVTLTARRRAATHVGDVVIRSQADVTALGCVTRIDGDLTIAPATPVVIDMPTLLHVTGNVSMRLPAIDTSSTTGGATDERCGRSSLWDAEVARVRAPALTRIGGELLVHVTFDTSRTTMDNPIDLGLNALTSLGGQLRIRSDVTGSTLCGLGQLTQLQTLTVTFGGADSTTGGLLPRLSQVAGDVSVSNGHTSVISFPELREVGGALHLSDFTWLNCDLPRLTRVGELNLIRARVVGDSAIGRHFRMLGIPRLLTGALRLEATDLEVIFYPDGEPAVDLSPDAVLQVCSEPALPQSQIDSFVTYQVTHNGWTPTDPSLGCP